MADPYWSRDRTSKRRDERKKREQREQRERGNQADNRSQEVWRWGSAPVWLTIAASGLICATFFTPLFNLQTGQGRLIVQGFHLTGIRDALHGRASSSELPMLGAALLLMFAFSLCFYHSLTTEQAPAKLRRAAFLTAGSCILYPGMSFASGMMARRVLMGEGAVSISPAWGLALPMVAAVLLLVVWIRSTA